MTTQHEKATKSSVSRYPPRLVFLGSGDVGKTSIINRFIYNTFEDRYHPTVEDIFTRIFEFSKFSIELELLDTGGTYNFTAMRRISMSSGSAFVLVFAQDDQASFQEVQGILEELKMERDDFGRFPLAVVCNKSDSVTRKRVIETESSPSREVSESEIMSWLVGAGLKPSQFIYASAKKPENIGDIFRSLWNQNYLSETPIIFKTIETELSQRMESSLILQHTNSSSFLQLQHYNDSPGREDVSSEFGGADSPSSATVSSGSSRFNKTSIFRSSLKLKRKSTKKKRGGLSQNIVTLNCRLS